MRHRHFVHILWLIAQRLARLALRALRFRQHVTQKPALLVHVHAPGSWTSPPEICQSADDDQHKDCYADIETPSQILTSVLLCLYSFSFLLSPLLALLCFCLLA